MGMEREVTTYDPKKVIITFDGTALSGYTDGTFVSIEPNGEGFTKSVGADGEVVRAISNDNTHTVTVTLQQSSLSNSFLSAKKNADKKDGAGMKPLEITDKNGNSLFSWAQAWVSSDPSWEFAKENSERQWVFQTGQASTQDEGESTFTGA
ncbi:hypothetical protein FACS1894172_14840 [Spirochaetia bacterium]|nr:hypothetical protein FACS1894172_14840 [Spirochaetia bacterium]